ncbi:TPA: archemetzincin [Candidatus Poribacteria bacterium]|nr:archemetzincin [Candidatus Poribacteria bacterium]
MFVRILPVGDVDAGTLEYLRGELDGRFAGCQILPSIPMPKDAYNPRRGQYLSTLILRELDLIPSPNNTKLLGVADEDLYVPQLNFVFGEARLGGKSAVIALPRLRQEFYGYPPNERLFRERMVKEAVHELGHTLGLRHCPNSLCVMHFSNSLRDTDVKSSYFCRRCLKELMARNLITPLRKREKGM